LIAKEAGPEFFVQSHPIAIGSLIFPSGSLEELPSREILSAGKVIIWLGPALAIGSLLLPIHPRRIFLFCRKKIFQYLQSIILREKGIFFS
jgi:hypothetical protein